MPTSAPTPIQMIETYRATVSAGLCDHLGHMNVQYYVAAVNEGAMVLMSRLGLTPSAIEQRRIAFAAGRMEIDYLREVREGDEIRLESGLEAVGGKSLTIRHRLYLRGGNHQTAEILAMDTKVRAVLMDLKARAAVSIPEDVRQAAETLMNGGASPP